MCDFKLPTPYAAQPLTKCQNNAKYIVRVTGKEIYVCNTHLGHVITNFFDWMWNVECDQLEVVELATKSGHRINFSSIEKIRFTF